MKITDEKLQNLNTYEDEYYDDEEYDEEEYDEENI